MFLQPGWCSRSDSKYCYQQHHIQIGLCTLWRPCVPQWAYRRHLKAHSTEKRSSNPCFRKITLIAVCRMEKNRVWKTEKTMTVQFAAQKIRVWKLGTKNWDEKSDVIISTSALASSLLEGLNGAQKNSDAELQLRLLWLQWERGKLCTSFISSLILKSFYHTVFQNTVSWLVFCHGLFCLGPLKVNARQLKLPSSQCTPCIYLRHRRLHR